MGSKRENLYTRISWWVWIQKAGDISLLGHRSAGNAKPSCSSRTLAGGRLSFFIGIASPERPVQSNLAFSRPNALSCAPGTVLKPMFTRFHALIAITKKVRSESSFSENCVRTRS